MMFATAFLMALVRRFWAPILAGVAVLAVAAALYAAGRSAERAAIEIENREAGNAADDARSAFDRCRDAGGLFDFATGRCRRAP